MSRYDKAFLRHPARLPDPLRTDLPLNDRVVVRLSGVGSRSLDFTKLGGAVRNLTLSWACAGGGGLRFTSLDATLAGSGCADAGTVGPVFGAQVPLAIARSRTWRLVAPPSTVWRLAVTTS
jgi:hypothetical protein